MYLRKLSIINFKNIADLGLEFSSRVNCFVGDNGTGKTNIIDAIYYLSMCKSSLLATDGQIVRHGEEFFVLDAQYLSEAERTENIVCGYAKGSGKSFKRHGKEYERLADHIGLFPIVIVSPSDSFLISDSADERRRYLNSFLSQLDREYLTAIMKYNHVIFERNKLLKQTNFAVDILEVIDMQLVKLGSVIFEKRKELVTRLAPLVSEYYRILSDDREQVELVYSSELISSTLDDLLIVSRERDRVCGFTSCGPHRDDLKMRIGGNLLKKYGSQGQQKSFLVALKLAQYMIVAEDRGEKPILLLDDLFDKLDMHRVEKLIALVSREEFGQIFITDCNKVRLQTILDRSEQPYALFNVTNGNIEINEKD